MCSPSPSTAASLACCGSPLCVATLVAPRSVVCQSSMRWLWCAHRVCFWPLSLCCARKLDYPPASKVILGSIIKCAGVSSPRFLTIMLCGVELLWAMPSRQLQSTTGAQSEPLWTTLPHSFPQSCEICVHLLLSTLELQRTFTF